MLMYTSCGWFFDELTGIETIQDILYAARAIQLALEVSGQNLEEGFLQRLEKAKSNLPDQKSGAQIYQEIVKPSILDLTRVGAHYAVSSLFNRYPEVQELYSYTVRSEMQEYLEAGRESLIIGRAILKSKITWEEDRIAFSILHLGDHHMFGGVREFRDLESYHQMEQEIKNAFEKSNVFEVIMLLDKHFGSHNYSFWHLFKDNQKKVLNQVLEQKTKDIDRQFRQVYDENYSLIQAINQLDQQLPTPLRTTVNFVMNARFRQLLEESELDLHEIRRLVEELQRVKSYTELDKVTLNFVATERITSLMRQVHQHPENLLLVQQVTEVIHLLKEAGLEPDLWWAQNYGYQLKQNRSSSLVPAGLEEEGSPEEEENFVKLFKTLNIQV